MLSLADHLNEPTTGRTESQAERLGRVVDLGVAAEAAGFESFGVGEHHFSRYIVSAPELVLATVAAKTDRIRLGTSVTLLANTDPVRQAEQLATLDVLSGGRAEMTFARGVSEATANAFGIADFEELRPRFEEYLRLVIRLFSEDSVSWSGRYRSPLDDVRLEPRPVQQPHPPISIGGGLSNTSVDLAASMGLAFNLPSLFRWPVDYLAIVERYRERFDRAEHGRPSHVGFPSYLHIAATSQLARRRWRPYLEHYRDYALRLRSAHGRPVDFESLLDGPAICGSPAQVVEQVLEVDQLLGLDRHVFMLDGGGVPPDVLADELDLLATAVLPELGKAGISS